MRFSFVNKFEKVEKNFSKPIDRHGLGCYTNANKLRNLNRPDESEVAKMKRKRTYIWAYLDGKKLVEVIQAALDNNMMVDDLKRKLIDENPGHEVTFKVVKR